MSTAPTQSRRFLFWIEDLGFRGLIRALHLLPYERRLATMGWFARKVIGPLAGYRDRALKNLAMVYPDKPEAERRAIADQALDTFGRTLIENYSRPEFRARIAKHTIEGPGLAVALEAQAQGRTVIFSSGHFGNHEATRTALDQAGFTIGAIYRPMKNPFVNRHYVESISEVSGPVFPRGRDGFKGFMDFLGNGGHAFLLFDVHAVKGQRLPFMGHEASTAFSAADLALRFDGLLIPYFNTRQPDGVTFKIELEEPIPHGDPRDMMTELTSRLEARIERDPGQWLWIHRRWKL
ncbi:MAG: lauroyl acyltransferase [Pseudomonadota bacterium]